MTLPLNDNETGIDFEGVLMIENKEKNSLDIVTNTIYDAIFHL